MPLQKPKQEAATADCKAALDEANRHLERLKLLWKLVTSRDSVGDPIDAMLALAVEALGMDTAAVGNFTDVYTVNYVYDKAGAIKVGMTFPVGDTLCQHVHDAKGPVFVEDLTRHPAFSHSLAVTQAGLRAYAGLPIWVGEGVHSVLAFFSRTPFKAPFGEADIAFMELLAAWLGNSLYQRQQQELLERLALTDPLTGLLNRRAAERRLTEEFARAKRHDEGFAIALVDLDHFKSINDRYGHGVGDQVLQGMAKLLDSESRSEDWVARWGGEEFMILLRKADIKEAMYVLERIVQKVRDTPIKTSVGDIAMTVSAGIGYPGRDDRDVQIALAEADSCLYQAKVHGRDRVEVRSRVGGILWMAQAVKNAVREERIQLASQPIVDLATGEIVADEALARMVMPDGSVLAANEFIDTAEGLGLMVEIDRQITRQAMARCTNLLAQGQKRPNFAHFVNLSPQFLARKNLVMETLMNAQSYCMSCGVEMPQVKPIVFEITERQFLGNLDSLEADLQPLLDFGFRLALDDFGSGYSSFLYLARLPISFLKIEGWMVANMRKDRKTAAIIESLARFCRDQGITTVAEWVEDEETARLLREMGVDWAQGWYYGRPELS